MFIPVGRALGITLVLGCFFVLGLSMQLCDGVVMAFFHRGFGSVRVETYFQGRLDMHA